MDPERQCPYCKSTNVTKQQQNPVPGYTSEVTCQDCKKQWGVRVAGEGVQKVKTWDREDDSNELCECLCHCNPYGGTPCGPIVNGVAACCQKLLKGEMVGQCLQDFIEQVKVERRLLVELFEATFEVGTVYSREAETKFKAKLAEVQAVIDKHQLRKKYPGRSSQ